jgi:hypothetical protein
MVMHAREIQRTQQGGNASNEWCNELIKYAYTYVKALSGATHDRLNWGSRVAFEQEGELRVREGNRGAAWTLLYTNCKVKI